MPKSSEELHGFLGEGVEFQGQLKFEGTVRIDGKFKGEIQATGTLVVGEGARVEAEIRCGTLVLHGEVLGNIHATNRLEAIAPARIRGNIQTPTLVINEGVFFEGNAKMDTSEIEGFELERKLALIGQRNNTEPAEEKLLEEGD